MLLLRDVNFTIEHQFREGNNAADFLALRGEEGHNNRFVDFDYLPRKLKGILRLDKAGLPRVQLNGFVKFNRLV